MSIIVATVKNLRALVANSNALKVGKEKQKDPFVVSSWILTGELGYMNRAIHNGSLEFAQEILKVVTPISEEAEELGWNMDGLPASTVYQARALCGLATDIEDMCNRRIEDALDKKIWG